MIKPELCSRWDVDVSRTGVTLNKTRVMKGHARAECKFPEGGTVKVDWPILVNLRLDPFERTGLTGSLLARSGSSLAMICPVVTLP